MCIAIYKPAGVTIPFEYLRNSFDNNPDGCGFAYINTDIMGRRRLKIKKTMSFEIFKRQYERATRVNPESPFIIHFRIATHGTVNKFNCHPFKVNRKQVFIHNGIISGVGTDPKKSDTQLFNELILKNIPTNWDKKKSYLALISSFIGASKIVTLNLDGSSAILGEKMGMWKDKCWFSNTSYTYSRKATVIQNPLIQFGGQTKKKQNGGERSQNNFTRGGGRSEYVTFSTKMQCDCCKEFFRLSQMDVYRGASLDYVYCINCGKNAVEAKFHNESDRMLMYKFIEEENRKRGYTQYYGEA